MAAKKAAAVKPAAVSAVWEAAAVPGAVPAAYIEAHGNGDRAPAAAELVQQAQQAWQLVGEIEALEEALKPLKKALGAALEGSSLVVPGLCRVTAARSTSVSIRDADKLRALLGERWVDLVIESVSYKPAEKLLEMASDGDDPLAPAYQALLTTRSSLTVRLLAEG